MNIDFWRSFARHFLQVTAFCCTVAVLTTTIWPNNSYLVQVGYCMSVGMLQWLIMEFGRLLIDEKHCHPSSVGAAHGWPKGWRGLLLVAIGIGGGYYLGNLIGS